ncbi:unnamed protein product, partial [Didymodactylos carnosus]
MYCQSKSNLRPINLINRNQLYLLEKFINNNYQSNIAYLPNGETDLHQAVYRANDIVVRYLLEHGWNPNQKDKNQRTPLHYTGLMDIKSFVNIIQLLCDYGANINELDLQHNTPLNSFILVSKYFRPYYIEQCEELIYRDIIIRYLWCFLAYKADINISNVFGNSPL